MRLIRDKTWAHRGISLLWSTRLVFDLIRPNEAMSIRQFFVLSRAWPSELPSGGGNTLVVAGFDGCVDTLAPGDAEQWLEQELKPRLLSFQDEFEGQAGVILWLPAGKQRVTMKPASEEYFWRCAPPFSQLDIPLGRILWGGSEGDAGRILDPDDKTRDFDGTAWVGLHHPRIS